MKKKIFKLMLLQFGMLAFVLFIVQLFFGLTKSIFGHYSTWVDAGVICVLLYYYCIELAAEEEQEEEKDGGGV